MNNQISFQISALRDYVTAKLSRASIFYLANCARWSEVQELSCYQQFFSDDNVKFMYYYHQQGIWAILQKVADINSDNYCQLSSQRGECINAKKNHLLLMLSELDENCIAIDGKGFKKLLVILAVISVCTNIVDQGGL